MGLPVVPEVGPYCDATASAELRLWAESGVWDMGCSEAS